MLEQGWGVSAWKILPPRREPDPIYYSSISRAVATWGRAGARNLLRGTDFAEFLAGRPWAIGRLRGWIDSADVTHGVVRAHAMWRCGPWGWAGQIDRLVLEPL
jgi:hypothetical protein